MVGEDAIPQGEHRQRRLQPSRRGDQVARHGLRRADRQARGVLPEHRLHRPRLGDVVVLGGGPVRVDVLHLFRRDRRVSSALRMAKAAPSPFGGESVMWYASRDVPLPSTSA